MTEPRRLHISPMTAVAATLSILLVGAGGMYVAMRQPRVPDSSHSASPGAVTSATSHVPATLPDVVVTLSKDAVDRAGISVTQISAQPVIDSLRIPGVVEPNAYRQVSVTPLVAGRVVKVSVQLGDRVRKGQSLAQVYSPELAEARTRYVAARAMLEAHDRELQRTEKLVEIGAASRQELERIHAEHAAQTAEVDSARARLRLLGADAEAPSASNTPESATTNVSAPIDGVVTERPANAGVNVDPTTKLLTIVDLSNVWIVGDVYERDLQRVREGQRAVVTTTAYPDQRLQGRVSFIDPQLNAATRTAKIRIEVTNPRSDLRLGMYTDVTIESASPTSVLVVPKEAVQSVGERQVVYLSSPGAPDRFIEREVRLGRSFGKQVEVLSGLTAGDSIVSAGSFYVRAEAERLGLRGRAATDAGAPAARVTVTEKGFEPDTVKLRAGIPARITFIRTTDKTCATEVVFPSMSIKRALPLNETVVIEFTPEKTGAIAFVCGMNMLKGAVVVE